MTDKIYLSATNGVDRRYEYNITNITQTNPCEITLDSNDLTVGDQIYISNTVGGMSQIRSKFVTIIAEHGTHYDIDLDTSSGYSTYTSGGYVSTYTRKITAIQNAANAKVDCKGHNLQVDDYVSFNRMEGMTELNEKVYRVTSVANDHFNINVDTSSFGTFTGGNMWNVFMSTRFTNYDATEVSFYDFYYVYHKTPDAILHELGVDDVQWSNGTNSITTTSDYSSVVSVGDFIGKPTAAGNGSKETYWIVNSVSSNSISFEGYYGLETELVTGLKVLQHVDIQTYDNYVRSIILHGNTTIEGGYDFDTNTFQGETWVGNGIGTTSTLNNGIYSFNSGNIVKNLNVVNCYGSEFRGNVDTIINCTFQGYGYGVSSSLNLTQIDNCCFMATTYFRSSSLILNDDTEFISKCYFYAQDHPQSEAIEISNDFRGKSVDFNESEVYAAEVGANTYVDVNFYNMKFYDCIYGINASFRNTAYFNCEFYRCNRAISATSSQSWAIYIKDCYFDSCDYGVYNQMSGLRIEDCTFANCDYDFYNRSGGNVYLVNNDHITPATNAVYVYVYSGTVDVIGDTIDAASLAKAFSYSTTNTNLVSPQLRLQDAFGYTGQIFTSYQILKNTDTTPVSIQTKFSTLTQQNLLDFKVASTYTKQSIGKLLKITMQAVSVGWEGELLPKIKLNEKTIFTGDAITSIPHDSETQLEYTIPGGLITKDGELSINFQANCNNVSVNLFNFEVTDV